MKRLALLLLLGIMAGVPVLGQSTIQVIVNGQPVAFDEPPRVIGGRVLVPVRGVFERLGAPQVDYDAARHTIVASRDSDLVVLTVGGQTATINGQPRTLDVPATMVGSRVLVPLRFVSEAMGSDVFWDERGQKVTITPATVAAPAPTPPPPVSAGPIIYSLSLDSVGPLRTGNVLTVTLFGEPRGQATFDVGNRTRLKMIESGSGTYRGSYTVRPEDSNPEAIVIGHLTLADGRSQSANAPTTIAIQGGGNGGGDIGNGSGHIIASVNLKGTNLTLGETLRVTMMGFPGGTATFDVGGRMGLPMFERLRGTYVGTYTVEAGDDTPEALVIVHLRTQDGRTDAMNAPQTVSLMGTPEAPPQALITGLTHNGLEPLYLGSPVNVTMYGVPGGQATFDVGIRTGIPMHEEAAGTYLGTYIVAAGDNLSNAAVSGHLVLRDGRNWSFLGPPVAGIYGVPNPAEARPTPRPVAGLLPALTSVFHNGPGPLFTGQRFVVTASGTPGCTATFSVGFRTFTMLEISSGTYRGLYTVQPGDSIENGPVAVTLIRRNQRVSLNASSGVSFVGTP